MGFSPNMPHRDRDDWKFWKTGWKYKENAPKDLQWQKDRQELFSKHGNGWWWFKRKRTDT